MTVSQKLKDNALKIIAPVVLVLLALLAWELIVEVGDVPEWVAAKPTSIFKVLFFEFKAHILKDALVTIKTLLITYPIIAVAGIAFAGVSTNSKIVAQAISPYTILLVCTPMMILVPLLMVLMGFGMGPRILVIVLQTFPLVNMNCSVGFLNVPVERRELMQSLKASRLTTFFRVTVPSSVTQIFNGLKIGFIVCINSCIAAEFAGGMDGLGAAIIYHTSFMRVHIAFALIFTVALIGMIGYTLISSLEKLILTWKE